MAKKKRKFKIIIDEDFCKGCNICVEICVPEVFTISEKINTKGYYVPIPTFIEKCNGCQLCDLSCPELAVILEEIPISDE